MVCKREKQTNKVPQSLLRTEIEDSRHKYKLAYYIDAPPPLNRSTVSVVCRKGVRWGGGGLGFCPLHTFINRNYVTEFPEHELQATHEHIDCTNLGRASK